MKRCAGSLVCGLAALITLRAGEDAKPAAPGAAVSTTKSDRPAIETFSRNVRECVQCHPAQATTHPLTPMAHAAETTAECSVLKSHPLMKLRLGQYDYRIERHDNQSLYIVTDGAETVTYPIRYALGLGEAGQTYIFENDGKYYESFVSYYEAIDGLDITIGDQSLKPSGVRDAAGRQVGSHEIATCLGCHTSNGVTDGHVSEKTLLPGISCEHCHGATVNHLAGLKKRDLYLAQMKKLTGMTAEESAQFCGQCHRTWEYVAEHGPHGVGNVRFQPYRLTNSKCFDVDDARISCTNCHNPHVTIVRVAAHYDAKCQACHGTSSHSGGKAGAKICKVGTKDCSTCHMPKIDLPGAHHSFTDHNIRIAVKNEPYPQ